VTWKFLAFIGTSEAQACPNGYWRSVRLVRSSLCYFNCGLIVHL